MKQFQFLFFSLLIFSGSAIAQQQYEIIPDQSTKIFKGIISRDLLEKEPSFTWYADNKKIYTPNPATVKALTVNKDSINLLVFMGTWCEDSHFVIPRFYSLLDAASVSKEHVSLIAVDRNKKTLGQLSETFNITNVPTIIVMKSGKEIGRVIEYGTSGQFDKDLGEIISRAY